MTEAELDEEWEKILNLVRKKKVNLLKDLRDILQHFIQGHSVRIFSVMGL